MFILLKNRQLDGGASKSITNNLYDFEAYWEIDLVPLLGVASKVTVSCTLRGISNLVTRNGNATTMLMFYTPLA